MYLFTNDDVIRSISYVRDNLRRANLPPQLHAFLTPYTAKTPVLRTGAH